MSVRIKNGTWIVEVYDPAKKRKRHVSRREIAALGLVYPMSENAARKVERRVIAALEQAAESGEVTCRRFAERWTADYPRPDESSNRTNAERVSKFGKDFGDRLLSSVTRQEARRWALENKGRLPAVRTMFYDALNDGLIDGNPFAKLRITPGESRKDRAKKRSPVTPAELDRLADVALEVHGELHGPVVRALILVSAHTGLRAGELFGLRWRDVKGDTIDVQRQYSSKLGREKEPKKGSTGVVYLPAEAKAALMLVPRRVDDDLVFFTKRGKRMTQSNWTPYWDKVRCSFGRPDLALHSLRHYCATRLLNDMRVEPWKVAKQLRHSDGGQQVLDTYGHPDWEVALEDIRKAHGANVKPLRSVDDEAQSA